MADQQFGQLSMLLDDDILSLVGWPVGEDCECIFESGQGLMPWYCYFYSAK